MKKFYSKLLLVLVTLFGCEDSPIDSFEDIHNKNSSGLFDNLNFIQ